MKTIAWVLFAAVVSALSACDASRSRGHDVPAFDSQSFRAALEKPKSASPETLHHIAFWKGWNAVLRNPSTGECSVLLWDGSKLAQVNDSPLRSNNPCKNWYPRLLPLETLHRQVKLDYGAADIRTESWRRRRAILLDIALPALVVIRIEGRPRPLWLTPYKLWPNGGYIGVLADDGVVVQSVVIARDGVRAE